MSQDVKRAEYPNINAYFSMEPPSSDHQPPADHVIVTAHLDHQNHSTPGAADWDAPAFLRNGIPNAFTMEAPGAWHLASDADVTRHEFGHRFHRPEDVIAPLNAGAAATTKKP